MRILAATILALGMAMSLHTPVMAATAKTKMAAKMYECPKCHATSAKAGDCPHCKVAMVAKMASYECTHCKVTSAKAGKCPKCGMAMTKVKSGKM
jgi:primosomal protein N'